jgi:hypothetical protein
VSSIPSGSVAFFGSSLLLADVVDCVFDLPFSIFCFVVFFFFLNNTISNTRAPITTTAPAIPPMMPPRSGPLIVDEDDADAIVLLRSVGGDVPVEFD